MISLTPWDIIKYGITMVDMQKKKKLVLLGEMSKKHVITKINVQKHCKCPKNMISP